MLSSLKIKKELNYSLKMTETELLSFFRSQLNRKTWDGTVRKNGFKFLFWPKSSSSPSIVFEGETQQGETHTELKIKVKVNLISKILLLIPLIGIVVLLIIEISKPFLSIELSGYYYLYVVFPIAALGVNHINLLEFKKAEKEVYEMILPLLKDRQ